MLCCLALRLSGLPFAGDTGSKRSTVYELATLNRSRLFISIHFGIPRSPVERELTVIDKRYFTIRCLSNEKPLINNACVLKDHERHQ